MWTALVIIFLLGWTVGRIQLPEPEQRKVAVSATPRVQDTSVDPAARLLNYCAPTGRQGHRAP